MTRQAALVLGARKDSAQRVFDHYADDVDFIDLPPAAAVGLDAELDAADTLMARTPYEFIVSTSESTMALAGLLRSRYGLEGTGHERTAVVTDKWRMAQAVRDHVPTPPTWLSGRFLCDAPRVATDVVVKPRASSSARGVRRMSAAAATDWLTRTGGLWVVAEAIDVHREFHCDGIVDAGVIGWMETASYDRPVLVSHGSRSTTILAASDAARPRLERLAADAIAALELPDGVFHLEVLQDDQTMWFGEIGFRPAGTGIAELLRLVTGVDLWAAFIASQLGRSVPYERSAADPAELSGLVMARRQDPLRPLLDRDHVRGLPGVLGIGAGNIAEGVTPANMCEFEYLAYFTGLAQDEVADLQRTIGGGRSPW